MELTPQTNYVAEVEHVSSDDASAFLKTDATTLHKLETGLRERVEAIRSDWQLSDDGQAEAIRKAGEEALTRIGGGRDGLADFEAERANLASKGNRFALVQDGKVASDEQREHYAEIRQEVRRALAQVDPDQRDVEARKIVTGAIESEDMALLGALFDGYATSPTLSPVDGELLEEAADALFRRLRPKQAKRLDEVEGVLFQVTANRARARKTVARLTGFAPEAATV